MSYYCPNIYCVSWYQLYRSHSAVHLSYRFARKCLHLLSSHLFYYVSITDRKFGTVLLSFVITYINHLWPSRRTGGLNLNFKFIVYLYTSFIVRCLCARPNTSQRLFLLSHAKPKDSNSWGISFVSWCDEWTIIQHGLSSLLYLHIISFRSKIAYLGSFVCTLLSCSSV